MGIVRDYMPFTFAKNKCMLAFAKSILEVGKCLPPDFQYNIEELMSSNNTIKSFVGIFARSIRSILSMEPTEIMNLGGAITTNGMTLSVTGDKYYDFNIHYFKLRVSHFNTKFHAELRSRMIVVIRYNGSSTATVLRSLFESCFKQTIGLELDNFTKQMTWVTDSSSNMDAMAGLTTSRKYDLTKKWMGCIADKLKKCTRHAIEKPYFYHHVELDDINSCLLYTSPSPRDQRGSRMPSSA